jgi:phosphoribosylformylglycinamidine synthase
MGAAGITSSASEMASHGNVGMELDLDKVPLRAEAMTPFEILISESQERMLLVVEKGKEDIVKQIMKKWGLRAEVMGHITDDQMMRIYQHGHMVAEVPAHLLADGAPQYVREGVPPKNLEQLRVLEIPSLALPEDFNAAFLSVLSAPNVASKSWIYQQFDHTVRTDTVIKPGMDAALVRIKGKKQAVAFTTDCNSVYCFLDPYEGAKDAVVEAARILRMVGAVTIGITDCLNFGNPEDPVVYWQMKRCVEGIRDACEALNIPVISGNVSLYNETENGPIYPTPVIGCAGLLEDVSLFCTNSFKDEGDIIVLLGEDKGEMGGSEYIQQQYGLVKGVPPKADLAMEGELQDCVRTLIKSNLIKSAHDVSDGGLAVCLAECAMGGQKGFVADIETEERSDVALFSESQSRCILSVEAEALHDVLGMASTFNVPAHVLGSVEGKSVVININGREIINVSLEECMRHYDQGLLWSMNGI